MSVEAVFNGHLYGVGWVSPTDMVVAGVADPLTSVRYVRNEKEEKDKAGNLVTKVTYSLGKSPAFGKEKQVSSLGAAFSGLVVTASFGSAIAFYNTEGSKSRIQLLPCGPNDGTVCAISQVTGGEMAATGGASGEVSLWNAQTGDLAATVAVKVNAVMSLAFSLDGSFLAVGGQDGSLHVINVTAACMKDDRCVVVSMLDAHHLPVSGVTFGGSVLFSCSFDRRICMWDLSGVSPSDSGAGGGVGTPVPLLHAFSGHLHWVTSLDYSRDTGLLLSTSADRSIKVWDVEKREELAKFEGQHPSAVTCGRFSFDGSLIASVSDKGTLVVVKSPLKSGR